jgi:hypothetical protein
MTERVKSPSAFACPRSSAARGGAPGPPPDARDLPHPLTFFVTGRQRARILRALRRIDGDRSFALLCALGLDGRDAARPD